MAENTAREIFVNKFLRPNRFLIGPAKGLQDARVEAPERFCTARLVFDDAGKQRNHGGRSATPRQAGGAARARDPGWSPPGAGGWMRPAGGRGGWAVLSSGGKDSLASYGLLRELGLRPHPVFVNESGRHWFTALNAYRGLRASDPATARVWTNADRLFSWMTRRLTFVRPDFARLRSDDYPLRLWTVAVFLFGALPVLRARGLSRLVVGNEHDTTRRVRFRGIRHYDGLFDQSLDFDRAVSRYFRARGWAAQCLSLLRPLSDLGIEKLLAERYPRLLGWQVSCHAARLVGGRALPCGACEKCRRIVALLAAAGTAPARCGYRREQVRGCLRVLAERREKALALEPADARSLLALLEARGLLPAGRNGARSGRDRARSSGNGGPGGGRAGGGAENGASRNGGAGNSRGRGEQQAAERRLLAVQLDPRRSPPGDIPVEVRGRLLAIYRRQAALRPLRSRPAARRGWPPGPPSE